MSADTDLIAHLCRTSLIEFCDRAWHVVRPGERFIRSWVGEAICEHLEAVARGDIRNLLISTCPGSAKSLYASVMWPAWIWTWAPQWQLLCASHSLDLSIRDSRRCRAVIKSDWYQETFQPDWTMEDDQDAKKLFQNTRMGFREALSTGGSTGKRGDATLGDDLISIGDAWSETKRESAWRWYCDEYGNRLNDMARGGRVVIAQRSHASDPIGRLIAAVEGGWGKWEHLFLPTEFVPKSRCVTSIGWSDPRTTEGELAFPELFPRPVVEAEKLRLGPDGFAKQHQQSPSPEGGGMFKAEWWRFWRHAWEKEPDDPELAGRTIVLPEEFDEQIQSWDMSLRDTASADFVSGGVLARKGGRFYLLAHDWRRMGPVDTMMAVRKMSDDWPLTACKLIEKAANGPMVIGMLEKEVPGMQGVVVQQGKEARAAAVSPFMAAGSVFLPLWAPWRDRFIEEHSSFPNGAHDDAVDMLSQALGHWLWVRPDPTTHPLNPDQGHAMREAALEKARTKFKQACERSRFARRSDDDYV